MVSLDVVSVSVIAHEHRLVEPVGFLASSYTLPSDLLQDSLSCVFLRLFPSVARSNLSEDC